MSKTKSEPAMNRILPDTKARVSFEEPFWLGLKKIAKSKYATLVDISAG
jgi:predicted DNA-binding ribbon-helix-helix protein